MQAVILQAVQDNAAGQLQFDIALYVTALRDANITGNRQLLHVVDQRMLPGEDTSFPLVRSLLSDCCSPAVHHLKKIIRRLHQCMPCRCICLSSAWLGDDGSFGMQLIGTVPYTGTGTTVGYAANMGPLACSSTAANSAAGSAPVSSTSLGHAFKSILPAMSCHTSVAVSPAEWVLEGSLHIWHRDLLCSFANKIWIDS